jgi:ATP-dependent Clp protease ATP-binding subunit ClpC
MLQSQHFRCLAISSTGLRPSFEEFHNLIIDDGAIVDAVDLSSRYITDRFLPDKAIDLIDEACSAKSMTYNFDTSEVTELKGKMQPYKKKWKIFSCLNNIKKPSRSESFSRILREVEEKKKKRVIPRKERLHITGSDVQRVIHQMTGVPLKNLEKEDLSRLR